MSISYAFTVPSTLVTMLALPVSADSTPSITLENNHGNVIELDVVGPIKAGSINLDAWIISLTAGLPTTKGPVTGTLNWIQTASKKSYTASISITVTLTESASGD